MLIPLLALLFQPSASVGGSGYGAPAVSYGAPEESYGAPAPAYGAPGYSSRSVSIRTILSMLSMRTSTQYLVFIKYIIL